MALADVERALRDAGYPDVHITVSHATEPPLFSVHIAVDADLCHSTEANASAVDLEEAFMLALVKYRSSRSVHRHVHLFINDRCACGAFDD